MKYKFINTHEKVWPIAVMCTVLNVTRSGYYAWKKSRASKRKREDRALTAKIKAVYRASNKTYGSPRVHAELRRQGNHHSRKRIARLMTENGLRSIVRKKYKVTTNSKHNLVVANNLLNQNFAVAEVNRVWVADITYVWTWEGWLYLAAVMDLHSRRVVGWALGPRMPAELACSALRMAICLRQPPEGLIHHSDRGSQYCSKAYQKILKKHGAKPSMSRKGNCWDNAPMESFFHSLKTELIHHQNYPTRAAAKRDIVEYITMFYNSQRLHSSLDYTTPVEFERIRLSISA